MLLLLKKQDYGMGTNKNRTYFAPVLLHHNLIFVHRYYLQGAEEEANLVTNQHGKEKIDYLGSISKNWAVWKRQLTSSSGELSGLSGVVIWGVLSGQLTYYLYPDEQPKITLPMAALGCSKYYHGVAVSVVNRISQSSVNFISVAALVSKLPNIKKKHVFTLPSLQLGYLVIVPTKLASQAYYSNINLVNTSKQSSSNWLLIYCHDEQIAHGYYLPCYQFYRPCLPVLKIGKKKVKRLTNLSGIDLTEVTKITVAARGRKIDIPIFNY